MRIQDRHIGHGGVLFSNELTQAVLSVCGSEPLDAIVSLGGNCSVAHNLRARSLRPFSLPFDWLLMDDCRPVEYLARGFRDGFSDFCLRINLDELKGDERGQERPGHLQLRDRVSGWKFIHHFMETPDFEVEYNRVYGVLRRRLDRLESMFAGGGRYLLILAPTFRVPQNCLHDLDEVLRSRFPATQFTFMIMSFAEPESIVETDGNVIYARISREQNIYDFSRTNFEWSFMDHLALRNVCKTTPEKHHKIRLFKRHGFRYVLKWFIEKKALKGTVE